MTLNLFIIKKIIEKKVKEKDLVNILTGQSNALLNSHNMISNINFGIGKSKDNMYWNGLIWHARVESYIIKNDENYGSI